MADSIKTTVQWFPGHMAKTRRKISEALKLVDAVTEIRDARLPESSKNPEIDTIISTKPRIILLNKSDYADENATQKWIEYYKQQGIYALAVECKTGKGLNAYLPLVRKVLADTIQRNEQKGMAGKSLRIMVVGIPNVGKSSFINRMAKNGKAKVADTPGVTRSNQWFVIGKGVELLDTPGVLWPKFEDKAVGDKLAFTGAVKSEVIDSETLALRLIDLIKDHYAERICTRYKMESIDSLQSWEILELIGRKRGMLIAGGEVDTERASVMLLDEFKNGKLGKFSFEMPEDMS
ncbi:MAG: ribosome biogenesis GTPase YlqF [Clostridia bacterium]|nr:ribosome biogenesis GTPase YlqF [Clostridia bacterium]